jgi:hypothetical protein
VDDSGAKRFDNDENRATDNGGAWIQESHRKRREAPPGLTISIYCEIATRHRHVAARNAEINVRLLKILAQFLRASKLERLVSLNIEETSSGLGFSPRKSGHFPE